MNRLRHFVATHPRRVFVLLNVLLVWTSIALVFRFEMPALYVTALLIILAEAPIFLRSRTRRRQAAVLYLAFLAFCFSFNLLDIPDHWSEVQSIGDLPVWIGGFFARGLFFVLFGHIYGLPFLPILLAANLFLFRVQGSGRSPSAVSEEDVGLARSFEPRRES